MASQAASFRMKILNAGHFLGLTSIHYAKTGGILEVSRSKVRSGWVQVQFLLIGLYQIFLLYQSFRAEGDPWDRKQVRYIAVLWIFMNCNQIGNLVPAEYVSLMNALEDFSRKKSDGKKGAVGITYVLAFVAIFATVTVTIAAQTGLRSLTLLTSLLPVEKERKIWLPWRLAIASFHFITNGFHFFAFWIMCTSAAQFSFDMSRIVEGMTPERTIAGPENSYRMSIKFARQYRALGVLQAYFAALNQYYMSIVQTAGIFSVVYNTYKAVIGGSSRSLILAGAVCLAHIQLIEATSKIYHTSATVLRKWEFLHRRDVPLWFPRFLKSCKNLCVPVGTFFHVDRGLVLTLLSIVMNASASLIVAN